MNLSYSLLAISVGICLLTSYRTLMLMAIALTTLAALYQEVITVQGLLFIMLGFAISHIYFKHTKSNALSKSGLLICLIIIMISFGFHWIPGFNNVLAIKHLNLSALSCPFSMHLNFDKTMAGLMIYVTSNLYLVEQPINKKLILRMLAILLACLVTVLIPGVLSGYIKVDVKIPTVLILWSLNNLLFVCFFEEVIFRGFLQAHLKMLFKDKFKQQYPHILIASMIFGLAHAHGGIAYIILASIAGGFYGYAYEKSHRIRYAMLVHFGLNLVHFIFFTYPIPIELCR